MKKLSIIVLVTALAYTNIFLNGPVIDDHVFVGKYRPSLIEAFRGVVPPGHEGVYRPIRGLFYTLYGSNPVVYHLNSLLVHLLSTIFVYLIIGSLIRNLKLEIRNLPFIAALLFGLHPIHTETITYIASAMDSIGIVFFLASFWLYLDRHAGTLAMTMSVIFAFLAFFTTEMTLTLPLLLLLYEGVMNHAPTRYKKILPYFGVLVFYLGVRFWGLGITSRGPYLANSFYLTMLSVSKVLIHYIWILIWPVKLVSNHIISTGIEAFVYRGYRTAAIASQSIFDPEILFSIGLIGLICLIGLKLVKKHPLVSFGIGWFFISLLPALEIVPQGSMMNEKFLYIPSIGFVLVISDLIGNPYRWIPAFAGMTKIAILLLILFYGVRTYARNNDWRDDVAVWSSDVRLDSIRENAYARFALGNAYNDRKDYGKAVEQYQKSVEINPGFAVGYASLARTYRDIGLLEQSNINYQKAEKVEPGFWTRP